MSLGPRRGVACYSAARETETGAALTTPVVEVEGAMDATTSETVVATMGETGATGPASPGARRAAARPTTSPSTTAAVTITVRARGGRQVGPEIPSGGPIARSARGVGPTTPCSLPS